MGVMKFRNQWKQHDHENEMKQNFNILQAQLNHGYSYIRNTNKKQK